MGRRVSWARTRGQSGCGQPSPKRAARPRPRASGRRGRVVRAHVKNDPPARGSERLKAEEMAQGNKASDPVSQAMLAIEDALNLSLEQDAPAAETPAAPAEPAPAPP